MLVGGASVEYLRNFADNEKNALVFVCYQGEGSLGRQIQDGVSETKMSVDGREETVKMNLNVYTIRGFTAHSGRNELLGFFNNLRPRPKKAIINHGEISKTMDLASSIYKSKRIETIVPKALETVRLR